MKGKRATIERSFDQVMNDLLRIEDCDQVVEFWRLFKRHKEEKSQNEQDDLLVNRGFYARSVCYDEFLDCFSGLSFEDCRRLSYVITLEGAAMKTLRTFDFVMVIKENGRMRHQAIFFMVLLIHGMRIRFDLVSK